MWSSRKTSVSGTVLRLQLTKSSTLEVTELCKAGCIQCTRYPSTETCECASYLASTHSTLTGEDANVKHRLLVSPHGVQAEVTWRVPHLKHHNALRNTDRHKHASPIGALQTHTGRSSWASDWAEGNTCISNPIRILLLPVQDRHFSISISSSVTQLNLVSGWRKQ